jgi:hypothetical protein
VQVLLLLLGKGWRLVPATVFVVDFSFALWKGFYLHAARILNSLTTKTKLNFI